jgi:hypothetical protein
MLLHPHVILRLSENSSKEGAGKSNYHANLKGWYAVIADLVVTQQRMYR